MDFTGVSPAFLQLGISGALNIVQFGAIIYLIRWIRELYDKRITENQTRDNLLTSTVNSNTTALGKLEDSIKAFIELYIKRKNDK